MALPNLDVEKNGIFSVKVRINSSSPVERSREGGEAGTIGLPEFVISKKLLAIII